MVVAVLRLEYDPSVNKTAEKFPHNKSQEQEQSETKLDDGRKKMVQARH